MSTGYKKMLPVGEREEDPCDFERRPAWGGEVWAVRRLGPAAIFSTEKKGGNKGGWAQVKTTKREKGDHAGCRGRGELNGRKGTRNETKPRCKVKKKSTSQRPPKLNGDTHGEGRGGRKLVKKKATGGNASEGGAPDKAVRVR